MLNGIDGWVVLATLIAQFWSEEEKWKRDIKIVHFYAQ